MKPKKKRPKPVRVNGVKQKTIEENPEYLQIEAEVLRRLRQAFEESGHLVVAIAHLNGADVRLWRRSHAFPVDDFDPVIDALEADLRKERQRIKGD